MSGFVANRFTEGLRGYLQDNQGVAYTIYRPDYNGDRELPCVVIDWQTMEQTKPELRGHYTVGGSVSLLSVGYDDSGSTSTDAILNDLETLLHDEDELRSAMNATINIHINAFLVRGMEQAQENKANILSINFEAFIRACD